MEELQSSSDDGPMDWDSRLPCDLDNDLDCDEDDVMLLEERLDACRGAAIYDPVFDVDGDGCISPTDRFYLFEQGATEFLFI